MFLFAIAGDQDLLNLQAKFVKAPSQWLRPFYFVSAFLAMFGTLYGTIDVAPAVMRELQNAFPRSVTGIAPAKTRRITILWVGIGGMLVLVGILGWQHFTGAEKPTALIAILTPANLFTGVQSLHVAAKVLQSVSVDAPRIGGEQRIGCGCRIGLAQPGLPKHLPAKCRQLVQRYVHRISSIGSIGI